MAAPIAPRNAAGGGSLFSLTMDRDRDRDRTKQLQKAQDKSTKTEAQDRSTRKSLEAPSGRWGRNM